MENLRRIRGYYNGDCPICGLYLSGPFDGWCPKCGKQTIGDEPSRYGEIEAITLSKLWGREVTKEEFLQKVKQIAKKE